MRTSCMLEQVGEANRAALAVKEHHFHRDQVATQLDLIDLRGPLSRRATLEVGVELAVRTLWRRPGGACSAAPG
jgi:hypothetical protein